ncbi:MAG: CoA-binding protein [Chloroflexi bacterium]|nr:CoA-binding protein [Chloroflexota bacterium]
MNDQRIRELLEATRTIASVGLSSNPERPSFGVASYLKKQGYRVIPVNPGVERLLGEQAYPDLLSVPDKIDVVQVFRRSEDVPPIVQQAIQVGARAVWMQEGITNEAAAREARAAGLQVVMDRCMREEHRRLLGARPLGVEGRDP